MSVTELPEVPGPVVPAGTGEPALSEDTRHAIARGMPESTRRKYEQAWADFAAWCEREDRVPLPASPVTLAEYATYLCYQRPGRDRRGNEDPGAPPGMSPATIDQALAAIRHRHKLAGTPLPPVQAVTEILKGYKRHLAETRDPRARQRQASPLSPADLEKMTTTGLAGEPPLIAARDRALIYLNFSAVTRASELVRINIEDIAEDERGLTVSVHRIKQGKHDDVRILARDAPKTIAAVKDWITVLAERGRTSGPLFPEISPRGEIAVTGTGENTRHNSPSRYSTCPACGGRKRAGAQMCISCFKAGDEGRIGERTAERRVRAAALKAGVKGRITVHSGRRGFVTYSRLAGNDFFAITQHGGWAKDSPAAKRYIEEADKERLNPLRGLDV